MMKRSEQEKAANRAAFHSLSPAAKAEHIWIYYKWFIILGAAALIILGSVVYRALTRKDPVLYLGFANVSLDSVTEGRISEGYLESAGFDPQRREILMYRDLYFSEEAAGEAHKMAYATQIKMMAAIEKQQMDLVLMSGSAWDILSKRGYLLDLGQLPSLSPALRELLAENEVILEDNSLEYELGEAPELRVLTEPAANALDLTELPLFQAVGLTEPLYFGIIANSPRQERCLDYVSYLLEAEPGQ